ncbi:hypothetical protein [Streptomyces beigongshangae]|uniref:hypothetical protein n=1 Tax=Streptomyces beigongshangae TaxID=2841597 RepID=UPI0021A77485|nr:hypothetical protein [Streptomyces sp. REN17]
MTYDSARPAPAPAPVSTERIARVVEGVPGVAFLRPGPAGRLRSTPGRPARPRAGRDRATTAGIRLSRPGRARDVPGAEAGAGTEAGAGAGAGAGTEAGAGVEVGQWHVEIHLVARRQARALDVARAVRRRVEAYLLPMSPAGAVPAHVTVTVTGQV